ncbi:MAG: hypothetical protein WCO45_13735 [Pseudanabaena sp. ELA607]|jgi:predicted DNA-binding ribbon-helix-helix protein
MSEQMREKILRVRLNDSEWAALQKLAEQESLTVPKYIRSLIKKLHEA